MTSDDFKTILVAIDGSPESAAGLEKAIRQAAFEGAARLHVVKATIVDRAKAKRADLIVIGGPCHGLWECGLRGCTAC